MERSSLTFRSATDADADAIAALEFHSFPSAADSVEARRRRFDQDPRFPIAEYLVGEAGGRVAASLHAIPFRTWVGGEVLPLHGVGSVVVAPDARRRGYASDLMREALARARAAGYALSALYPFRHSFYAALGYATAVERRAWTLVPADLPHYPERRAVRIASGSDLPAIASCYERVARRSTLMVERSDAAWTLGRLDAGRRYAAIYEAGADVRGYFLYQYKELSGDRHTRLFVTELVYEDQEALRGLLGHVAALRDQFTLAEVITTAEERLDLRLANPRSGGAIKGQISRLFGPKVLYGATARVVDVPAALRARGAGGGASGTFRLEVEDPVLPENRGPWAVTIDGGRFEVEAAGSAGPVARTDVGTLAQIYLGYVRASAAREIGILDADAETAELLDAAFAGPRASLLDHF